MTTSKPNDQTQPLIITVSVAICLSVIGLVGFVSSFVIIFVLMTKLKKYKHAVNLQLASHVSTLPNDYGQVGNAAGSINKSHITMKYV